MVGNDFAEFTIKAFDDEQTLTKKYPVYHDGSLRLSHDDPTIVDMVQSTIKDFKGSHPEVQINIKYMW